MYLNLLRRFLTGLYALVIGLYLSVIVGHSIVQSRAPWTTAATPEPSTRIDAFTFDMQGSPWLLTNGPNKDKRQILHITETGTEKWDLPSGEESSGTWPPNYYGPELLEVDMNRQPWVALHPYGLLHWTEGGWQWFQFSGDLRTMKRVGSTLWVLTSDEQYNINSRLFSIDPETSEMLAMPLPEPEIQSGMIAYDFRVTPDDSLLVLASNGDRFSISVLKDNRWQGSPVTLERGPGYLADFTRDASGNIWALTIEGGYCQTHYQIGLYEIQTDHWHWNDLSLNDYCDGELFTVSYFDNVTFAK